MSTTYTSVSLPTVSTCPYDTISSSIDYRHDPNSIHIMYIVERFLHVTTMSLQSESRTLKSSCENFRRFVWPAWASGMRDVWGDVSAARDVSARVFPWVKPVGRCEISIDSWDSIPIDILLAQMWDDSLEFSGLFYCVVCWLLCNALDGCMAFVTGCIQTGSHFILPAESADAFAPEPCKASWKGKHVALPAGWPGTSFVHSSIQLVQHFAQKEDAFRFGCRAKGVTGLGRTIWRALSPCHSFSPFL